MATHAHIPREDNTQQRTIKTLVLQPRSSTQTYTTTKNQTTSNRLHKANLFTFTQTNKRATDQPKHWALLSPCQNNRVATQAKILSIGGLKIKKQKRNGSQGRQSGPPQFKSSTFQQFNWGGREALHGETGFARVFGPQNEGYEFNRKRNSSLDTSMAKPTPKHLLRMVEREVHLECFGASVERPV